MLVVLATAAAALLWHRLAVARRLFAEQQLMLVVCERAIADRASALEAAQARLRAADDELRDADWRKEQNLSVVAHELRAPLAPICIAVALLKRDGLSADVRAEAHQVIDRQMARMVKVIDNLLGVGSAVKAWTQASSVADGREPEPAGSAVKTAIVEPLRLRSLTTTKTTPARWRCCCATGATWWKPPAIAKPRWLRPIGSDPT